MRYHLPNPSHGLPPVRFRRQGRTSHDSSPNSKHLESGKIRDAEIHMTKASLCSRLGE